MPNPLYRAAVTGVRAQQMAMDIIANNLANVSTTGYKRVRTGFRDLLYQRLAAGRVPDPTAPVSPTPIGGGVRADVTTRLFSQGAMKMTNRVLDLAIAGEGFFQVRSPSAQGGVASGQVAYTRDGSLQLDASGRLTTATGDLIDPPVTLPEDLERLWIDDRGTIFGTRVGGEGVLTLGQLQLARFTNPGGLSAIGNNLFIATPNSGPAQTGQPGQDGLGTLASGVLESANVDLGDEMAQMVQAQRAYQLNLKALQTIDDMTGQALNLRR
jgi:flagellar basal-body rod protein FlgG